MHHVFLKKLSEQNVLFFLEIRMVKPVPVLLALFSNKDSMILCFSKI